MAEKLWYLQVFSRVLNFAFEQKNKKIISNFTNLNLNFFFFFVRSNVLYNLYVYLFIHIFLFSYICINFFPYKLTVKKALTQKTIRNSKSYKVWIKSRSITPPLTPPPPAYCTRFRAHNAFKGFSRAYQLFRRPSRDKTKRTTRRRRY